MKYPFLIFLFLCNSLSGQVRSFKLYGNQLLDLTKGSLNLYAGANDSFEIGWYGIYEDSLIKVNAKKIPKSTDRKSKAETLNIQDLDSDFNLQSELNHKVLFVSRNAERDFYYLKNDSIWVHIALVKEIVWKKVKEEYAPFYRIDLGNKRFIYWANSSGILYKKDGVVKTNFHDFKYFYKDPGTHFTIMNMDSVDMSYGYFDYGDYKIELKNYDKLSLMDTSYDYSNGRRYKIIYRNQADLNDVNREWKYSITKWSKVLLNDIDLKYFNKNKLIAIDSTSLYFYNPDLRLDSQFRFRTMFQDWSSIEFLTGNNIKTLPLEGLTLAIPDNRLFVCGTVTHYKMQIQGKSIVESVNGNMTNQRSFSRRMNIRSMLTIDSMRFINSTKEMAWSDNGGFDDRIILYKAGKSGLYKFEVKDSVIFFTEILPQAFDKIYMLNNLVFVSNSGHDDIVEYYKKNKKLRFITIDYVKSNFLRYQKNDRTMGWMAPYGDVFDDIKENIQ